MSARSLRTMFRAPSLVRRLTVALAIIAGGTAVLAVGLFSAGVRGAEEAEIQRNVVSSVTVAARILEPAVWDLDMDRAAALGEAFAQDPRVVRLTIDETSGERRIVHRSSATDTIAASAPIVHGGQQIGAVRLVFSRALYRERAQRQVRQALGLGLLVLAIALTAVQLLLGRLLRRPLAELTRTVGHYATGEFAVPSPSAQYVEFMPFWDVLDRMAARINDQIHELREANVRAERARHAQKLEAIGQLAGGVAHDFNNIVTAIQLQLELLEVEHALAPPVRRVVRDVRTSADRAAGVARQLLAFSRQQPMTIARVDLGEVVAEQLRLLARVLGAHITMRHEPAPVALPIDADAGMIELVVMNLCLNARDAMPDGGTITIRTHRTTLESAEVTHPDARTGTFACMEVVDTGIGMSAETLQHIFEPFFTTKSVGEGTGLGLATSHGIVVQHRGWIDVDSAPGAGTTFRVYLPIAQASEVPNGPTTTILVTGSDGPAIKTAARALRRLGHEVCETPDADDAMRVLTERTSDVRIALVDAAAGADAAGALGRRLRATSPALAVIVLSDVQASSAHGLGAHRVLVKPFTLADLRAAVDDTLRERVQTRLE